MEEEEEEEEIREADVMADKSLQPVPVLTTCTPAFRLVTDSLPVLYAGS